MKCDVCGQINPPESTFCTHCGRLLAGLTQSPHSKESKEESHSRESKEESHSRESKEESHSRESRAISQQTNSSTSQQLHNPKKNYLLRAWLMTFFLMSLFALPPIFPNRWLYLRYKIHCSLDRLQLSFQDAPLIKNFRDIPILYHPYILSGDPYFRSDISIKFDLGEQKKWQPPEDLHKMVKIPLGWFGRGGKGSQTIFQWRKLPTFWIDKYEVTNAQYQQCVLAKKCKNNAHYKSFIADSSQAVVGVSWFDAHAYCQFVKKRLPSSKEWEKAARGSRGKAFSTRSLFPSCQDANYGHPKHRLIICKKNPAHPVSARFFRQDRSPFGVFQMTGNVREWTSSCLKIKDRYCIQRELRGGGWRSLLNELPAARYIALYPFQKSSDIGFRCVWP